MMSFELISCTAGKRHGKGEGLILSVPLVGSSPGTIENGFYSGGWKNNMRYVEHNFDGALVDTIFFP